MDPKSICQEGFGARLNVSDFLILCSIEITWQERSGKEDVHQKLQPLQAQSFFQCKCIPGEVHILSSSLVWHDFQGIGKTGDHQSLATIQWR